MKMINELLGIKYPILQGGMANIADGRFAAAVSNAGGMGVIGTGAWDKAKTKAEIDICKSLTDKPFGVNIMLMNQHADDLIDLVCEEGIKFVTTGAGNPSKYIKKLKEHGIIIFPVVPTVALAMRMEMYGVDGVIAEGTEAGGHVGEQTTFTLVPQVVDAVKIPVVAAGGIADNRGFRAALALGASGVQIGTCLLASDECLVHENYKQAVVKAKDSDTVVTGRMINAPVRILKNQMARKYQQLEKEAADREEFEKLTLGALRRAVFDGDVTMGSVMIGQSAGLVKCIRSIKDILKDIAGE